MPTDQQRRQARIDRIRATIKNRQLNNVYQFNIKNVRFIIQIVTLKYNSIVDINVNIRSHPEDMPIRDIHRIVMTEVIKIIQSLLKTNSFEINISADYEVENNTTSAHTYKDIFSRNNIAAEQLTFEPSNDTEELIERLDSLLDDDDNLNKRNSQEGYILTPIEITRVHVGLARKSQKRIGNYTEEIETTLSKLNEIQQNAILVPKNDNNDCLIYCLALKLEIESGKRVDSDRQLNLKRKNLLKYVDELKPIKELYTDDEGFILTKKNLTKVCDIIKRNIFVYTMSTDRSIYKYFSCPKVFEGEPINLFYCPSFTRFKSEFETNTNSPSQIDTEYGHFCLIKDLYRFTIGEYKQNSKVFLCDYCNITFRSEPKYTNHLPECKLFHNSDIKRNILNSKLECDVIPKPIVFKDVHMKTPMKLWGCYDFETTQDENGFHSPVSVGILFFEGEKVWKHYIYSDGNPSNVSLFFLEKINEFRIFAAERLQRYPYIDKNEPKPENNGICGLCEGSLSVLPAYLEGEREKDENGNYIPIKLLPPVLHHDHFSGKNICYAHSECNVKELRSKQLTFFALNHNFDIKCYLSFLYKPQKFRDVEFVNNYSVVTKSREKFLSITMLNKKVTYVDYEDIEKEIYLPRVNFYDALAFLGTSLEKSVDSLSESELIYTKEYFNKTYINNPILLKAALKKGFYPYEWMTFEKFSQKEIPSIDDFKTELNGAIKPKDYKQVEIVWNELKKHHKDNMNFEKYNNFYLEQDIFLLADCMNTFRKSSLEAYSLDPFYCATLPGAAHRSSLLIKARYNKKPCYTLTDPQLYLKFQQNITGGYSAMGKHMNTPGKLLFYLDFAAMYSCAMSEYILPYKYIKTIKDDTINFYKSITPKKLEKTVYFIDADIDNFNDDENKFKEICHKFRHYLPFPENLVIKKEWLAPYQLEKGEPTDSKKLIMNFFPKTVFVDYRYLELAERIGCIRIKKINSIVVFHGEAHLSTYVNLTRDLRNKATSDAAKNYLKLYNNAIYGRQLVNVLNFENSKFVPVESESTIIRQNNHPHFKSFTLIGDEMIMYQKSNPVIKLTESVYTGKCVLDLSKRMMLEFLYCKLLPAHEKLGLDFELLGTDTDSVFYEVTPTKEITNQTDYYTTIQPMIKCLDFSDFPPGFPAKFEGHKTLDSKLYKKVPHTLASEFKSSKTPHLLLLLNRRHL